MSSMPFHLQHFDLLSKFFLHATNLCSKSCYRLWLVLQGWTAMVLSQDCFTRLSPIRTHISLLRIHCIRQPHLHRFGSNPEPCSMPSKLTAYLPLDICCPVMCVRHNVRKILGGRRSSVWIYGPLIFLSFKTIYRPRMPLVSLSCAFLYIALFHIVKCPLLIPHMSNQWQLRFILGK